MKEMRVKNFSIQWYLDTLPITTSILNGVPFDELLKVAYKCWENYPNMLLSLDGLLEEDVELTLEELQQVLIEWVK